MRQHEVAIVGRVLPELWIRARLHTQRGVAWRGGLARASDSVQLQIESAPQLLHFFITPAYRGHRTWRLGQRLLTWWRATHSLHAFIVVEPNAGMHGALRHNGCVSQSVRQGVETSELFTCYPPG